VSAAMPPPPRPVRAAFAAASLSARAMHLGNAMVAAGIFSSAGFVLQQAANELHAYALELLQDLHLSERQARTMLALLSVPSNDVHPAEFLHQSEALKHACGALCGLAPDDRIVWASLSAFQSVFVHVHEVSLTAAELKAGRGR
jgi:hypothetical protein